MSGGDESAQYSILTKRRTRFGMSLFNNRATRVAFSLALGGGSRSYSGEPACAWRPATSSWSGAQGDDGRLGDSPGRGTALVTTAWRGATARSGAPRAALCPARGERGGLLARLPRPGLMLPRAREPRVLPFVQLEALPRAGGAMPSSWRSSLSARGVVLIWQGVFSNQVEVLPPPGGQWSPRQLEAAPQAGKVLPCARVLLAHPTTRRGTPRAWLTTRLRARCLGLVHARSSFLRSTLRLM
ncbi:hypothetical protein Salat_2416900 [Sesamum alatum]|uniref:Uncharacterized protein n=1 Tax=Sesamum alatum TaxID=300844 RepID=A0AAE1XXW2_9LAMI|nr:hypothetical protein Salat_2416900 [Sesamum alatum]